MNKHFFGLPDIKQQKILNAGYKVFSSNTYKKASMQLIADEAGISKSLLFHYFHNKQTLYEFLFLSAIRILQDQEDTKIYTNGQDFFDLLEYELNLRLKLIKRFPFKYRFLMRVYDENSLINNKEVNRIISESIKRRKMEVLNCVDKSKFRHEDDLEILYEIIIDLSSGFYFRVFDNGKMEKEGALNEFRLYLKNLKRNYYREEK